MIFERQQKIDVQKLCMNCLVGTIKNGTCTYCHASAGHTATRMPNALPERYLLGNQYYLGKVMGKGGFGITYMAWDAVEQRRLIVKELFPNKDVQRDPETQWVSPVRGQEDFFQKCKLRFRQEAQTLYQFRAEPSVLNVYRLMEENNTVYYSMEYLSGFDLATYLRERGRLGWEQMSAYAEKILRTLYILHGQGLIHRDISPDNIILTSDTGAKIIDFGSVRCFNDGRQLTTLLKQAFAPPEQYLTNGNQGPWTDIYSLCVTMYYALSGKLPPNAMTRLTKLRAGQEDVTPLTRLCPDMPQQAAEAVMKGMRLEVAERYPSAEALAEALFPQRNVIVPSPQTGLPRSHVSAGGYQLSGVEGRYNRRVFSIAPGGILRIGRSTQSEISYPGESPGVSRNHCCLWCSEDGSLYIRDERSTYGTYVSGYRLEPGRWYRLARESVFSFAAEKFRVE